MRRYATAVYAVFFPSICPSVTIWSSTKTAKYRITSKCHVIGKFLSAKDLGKILMGLPTKTAKYR